MNKKNGASFANMNKERRARQATCYVGGITYELAGRMLAVKMYSRGSERAEDHSMWKVGVDWNYSYTPIPNILYSARSRITYRLAMYPLSH